MSLLGLIIDCLMLLQMGALVGIGLLVKFVLVPGYERNVIYGRGADLYVFGLDRHEWGTVHMWIGVSLVVVLAVHIVLHWNRILGLLRGVSGSAAVRAAIAIGVLLLAAALASFPLWVAPEVETGKAGEGPHWGQREDRQFETGSEGRPSGGQRQGGRAWR
jgi:hypothetical protein